ncbi:MAG TPA: helix-turn-helix domain-containing protein [Frankiaceae bacterium]|jgi:AraC family transcriptional activator FtrA|nr:helix-turn-helix domain-containing protein [Frankiaceae bacterium]
MALPRVHRVVALAYPGVALFELSAVVEVFGLSRPELDVPWWYAMDVCAITPGPQKTNGGMALHVKHGLKAIKSADTVILPCWPVDDDVPVVVTSALQAAYARGARLVSICSGAFALAATGLLDGRRAATHWQYADKLARRYPLVDVDPEVLYVDDDDRLLTAAGSAAAIDLCLHLVRKDHGAVIANQVARRLVVQPHRDGGQAQYMDQPVASDDDARIHQVIGALDADLAQAVAVPDLAARAHLSTRQFSRRFQRVTGESPIEWLIGRRIAASLPLLESGDDPIDRVSGLVGFATVTTFRHHFRARMHTSPTAYRRAFRR